MMRKGIFQIVVSLILTLSLVSCPALAAENSALSDAKTFTKPPFEEVLIENTAGEFDYESMKNQIYRPIKDPKPTGNDKVRNYVYAYVLEARYTPQDELSIIWGMKNLSPYDQTVFDVYNVYAYYFDANEKFIPIAKTDRRCASGITSPFVIYKGENITVAQMVFQENEFDHSIKLSELTNMYLKPKVTTSMEDEFEPYHFSVSKLKDSYDKDVILKSVLKTNYTKVSVKKMQYTPSGAKVTLQIDNESNHTIHWMKCVNFHLFSNNLGTVLATGENVFFAKPCDVLPGESKEVSLSLKSGQFDPTVKLSEVDYIRFDGAFQ